MEERLMSVKKMIVVVLSMLAIFAILALIRQQNNMLVSDNGQKPAVKAEAKPTPVATRDV